MDKNVEHSGGFTKMNKFLISGVLGSKKTKRHEGWWNRQRQNISNFKEF